MTPEVGRRYRVEWDEWETEPNGRKLKHHDMSGEVVELQIDGHAVVDVRRHPLGEPWPLVIPINGAVWTPED